MAGRQLQSHAAATRVVSHIFRARLGEQFGLSIQHPLAMRLQLRPGSLFRKKFVKDLILPRGFEILGVLQIKINRRQIKTRVVAIMAVRIEEGVFETGDEIAAGAEDRPSTGAGIIGALTNAVIRMHALWNVIAIFAVDHRLVINTINPNAIREKLAGVAQLMHDVTQPRLFGEFTIHIAVRRMNRNRMIERIRRCHRGADLPINRRLVEVRLIITGQNPKHVVSGAARDDVKRQPLVLRGRHVAHFRGPGEKKNRDHADTVGVGHAPIHPLKKNRIHSIVIACFAVEHHKRFPAFVAAIIVAIVDDHRMIGVEALCSAHVDIILEMRVETDAVAHAIPICVTHQQKRCTVAVFESVRPRFADVHETVARRGRGLERAGGFQRGVVAFGAIIPHAAFARGKTHAPNLAAVPEAGEAHFFAARRRKNAGHRDVEVRVSVLLRRGEAQFKARIQRHSALRPQTRTHEPHNKKSPARKTQKRQQHERIFMLL
ncbi:MAG: hypothetical protein ALAOOOJD_04103 [bacterium]|nr:hypothetical protein [bacterium]